MCKAFESTLAAGSEDTLGMSDSSYFQMSWQTGVYLP